MKRKPSVKFNAYTIISDAVAAGVRSGLYHAYKHSSVSPGTHGHPSEDRVCEVLEDAVMVALCEVLQFEDEP